MPDTSIPVEDLRAEEKLRSKILNEAARLKISLFDSTDRQLAGLLHCLPKALRLDAERSARENGFARNDISITLLRGLIQLLFRN